MPLTPEYSNWTFTVSAEHCQLVRVAIVDNNNRELSPENPKDAVIAGRFIKQLYSSSSIGGFEVWFTWLNQSGFQSMSRDHFYDRWLNFHPKEAAQSLGSFVSEYQLPEKGRAKAKTCDPKPNKPMDLFTLGVATQLANDRKAVLERVLTAERLPVNGSPGGCLGITLFGKYQSDEFVAQIRPKVVNLLRRELADIDRKLAELGVIADPIHDIPDHVLEHD